MIWLISAYAQDNYGGLLKPNDLDTISPVSEISIPEMTYAVVVKQSTYNLSDWRSVVEALQKRYEGQVFIWIDSLSEISREVSGYNPSHIGFVCEVATASPEFVQNQVWPFVRNLDNDAYADAIWGIITGYNSEDALRLVTGPAGFNIKTVLGGTASCDLSYFTQGIGTSETTTGLYYLKYPDSVQTIAKTDGPPDRTAWLVSMLNDGIGNFRNDPVDIFYTSGHGNKNAWQMHYPTIEPEGFFRSDDGKVYGESPIKEKFYISSDHPKVYFGLGNCYIGKIEDSGSMVPSWIHSGRIYQYTGYVVPEGSASYQHGGTAAYFYKEARNNTWAEAYFLANISLQFDIINNTSETDAGDLNGSAFYGDPGMQVKMSDEGEFQSPLFRSELLISHGKDVDTITYRITMNRKGTPGFTGKWGERHPAIIFPFRANNIRILKTDAISAVVNDNFGLLYIWRDGDPALSADETRQVIFTCDHVAIGTVTISDKSGK